VLVSSLIKEGSPPGQVVKLIRDGGLRLVVDDRILAEYDEVLNRPELRAIFSVANVDAAISGLLQRIDRVECDQRVDDLPDADDTPFLETALTAGVPLVTGNLKHFPKVKRRGAEVLSPSGFLKKYFS
jgi:putative PIN family toxin of toxin-antitoxin system